MHLLPCYFSMKRVFPFLFIISVIICANAGCKKSGIYKNLPEDFSNFADTAKVAYLMGEISPDSLARFICDEVLKPDSIKLINSLNESVRYAYIKYPDSLRIIFGKEIDAYSDNLPLENKTRLYYLAKGDDPIRLGYKIGKEYIQSFHEGKNQYDELNKVLEIFEIVSNDGNEFMYKLQTGIKTALQAGGIDLDSLAVGKLHSTK